MEYHKKREEFIINLFKSDKNKNQHINFFFDLDKSSRHKSDGNIAMSHRKIQDTMKKIQKSGKKSSIIEGLKTPIS